MNTFISIGLLVSGLLTISILGFLVIFYLQTNIFGAQKRHISARIGALEIQAKGFSLPALTNRDYQQKDSVYLFLDETRFIRYLRRQITRAGLTISASYLLIVAITVSFFISLITYIASNSSLYAILIGLSLCTAPYFVLELIAQRRQAALQKQIPELMDFMARSLQVGHSLNNTIQMAAIDAPMPIAAEFNRVFEELNYGAPIHKVLSELSERIDCAEIRYFVIAVIVNREIGGDLAEILKRVSKLIRERMDMQQTIRVLTSEGRASALVLGALPFAIGALIFFIQPKSYELMLSDSLGQSLLIYASVLMLIGFAWMKHLCNLKQ
jgi:tight adherence protein B